MNRTSVSNIAAAASLGSALRDVAEVDAAEDQQPGAEHEHGRGQAKPGSDQGPPVAPGDVHPEAEQQQRKDRQRS
jgi:hypothetical protein